MKFSCRYLCIFLLLLCAAALPFKLVAAVTAVTDDNKQPILIICSYNPAAQQTSTFISDFMDEYKTLGGRSNIEIENMNCKSFSESPRWKGDMTRILAKYRGEKLPKMIVLLGQEAWAAYISQDDSIAPQVPAICSLASRNAVILPTDTVSLKDWMPEPLDLFTDSLANERVRSGYVYEYDIPANIQLIKHFYPHTQHIAFLSDNTYGGVSMQALVRKEMEKFPELDLILMDGRSNTVYTLTDEFRKLPENTVILVGTWRVDMNDGYFMRNATYTMMDACPTVPAFSMSTIALGYWAIGGVMPAYRDLGRGVGREAFYLERNPGADSQVVIIGSETVMDSQRAKEMGVNLKDLPFNVNIINEELSFYEQYTYQIWTIGGVVILLVLILCVVFYFYLRTKHLKDELISSEAKLRVAKDRAEESNRLKSAFLANMSHEIRTPLNAIVGFSDVLVAEGCEEADKHNYAEIIKLNSDLLLRLINDILDISRLESDRIVLAPTKCDVVQLCKQALTSIEFSRKTNNKLVFYSTLNSYEMRVDPQRMQQVISNLLYNAIKFTQDGVITLSFEIDEERNRALIAITDTGCGIPKEKQKRVFERFEKLNEYAQGTGLGLSICKLTVEKWGGEIWIDSEYTKGARFVFSIPLQAQ